MTQQELDKMSFSKQGSIVHVMDLYENCNLEDMPEKILEELSLGEISEDQAALMIKFSFALKYLMDAFLKDDEPK